MKKKVFSYDKSQDSPGMLLWQTTITWQRLINKALAPYAITHAQFVILAITLWFQTQEQTVLQSMLIRQSKLDKMTVSKSLKNLVSAGYIHRVEDIQDTRAKAVTLTNQGEKLITELIPVIEQIDENFFQPITLSERQTVMEVLGRLVKVTE